MKKIILFLVLLYNTSIFAWEPVAPITVVVGYSTGSTNEIVFRKAAEIINKNNPKVIFIIESRPGVDGVIAMNHLVSAKADGYTIGVPSLASLFVTNDIWQRDIKKFNWDSFSNVLTLGKSPSVIIASPSSLVNTPEEFIQLIKNTDRPINVAVAGGTGRLIFDYMLYQTKGNTNQVKLINYSNSPLAAAAVAANDQTEFGMLPVAIAYPLAQAGKIKIIGVASKHRLAQLPNVPVMHTLVPGMEIYSGYFLALPPNTPKDVISWYQKEFTRAITSKEYQDWAHNLLLSTSKEEMSPTGLKKYAESLRSTFMPVGDIIIKNSKDQ